MKYNLLKLKYKFLSIKLCIIKKIFKAPGTKNFLRGYIVFKEIKKVLDEMKIELEIKKEKIMIEMLMQ